jgi:lipopolysaccharide export system protein LptA
MLNAKLALGFAALAVAGSIPVLALAAAPAATTPAPASSGSGLSSNQPVDITADEAEVQQEQRKVTWRGNVEAIQGANRLRTPVLVVYYAAKEAAPAGAPTPPPKASDSPTSPGNSIERMEAQGPVYFVTPTQTAKGDAGVYTAADDSIVLTGNVVLVQDRNVAKGDKLTIHQKTGQSVLVSNAKGRGTPGRVRGVFYPSQTQATGAAPPAAPKAGGAR